MDAHPRTASAHTRTRRARAMLASVAAGVLVSGVNSTPAAGQLSIGATPTLTSYRFDDSSIAGLKEIQMVASPFAAAVSLGSFGSVTAAGSYAMASAIGLDGTSTSLAGITDTQVLLSLSPWLDWLALSLAGTIPTGVTALSAQDAFVAASVAAELLPFPVRAWGSGASFGGDVTVVRQVGAWGVGLSAGYRLSGSFEAIPDQPFAYRPGDQVQLRLALDGDVGASGTVSMLLGMQRFSEDQFDGQNLFRPGLRLQGLVSYAFAVGRRGSALLFGGLNHRSNGAALLSDVLSGLSDTPSQQLFSAGTNVRWPLSRGVALILKSEGSAFRAADGVSQGWVATGGGSLDVRLAGNASRNQVFLTPSGSFRLGSVEVQQGSTSSFAGFELALGLRVAGGAR
jgi:hypothetical protein